MFNTGWRLDHPPTQAQADRDRKYLVGRMGEQRVTGVDQSAWPDVRQRPEPRPSRHLGRVVGGLALVVIALTVLFDAGVIGSTSTVMKVPSSGPTSYSFMYTCPSPPVGIQIQHGSR